MCQARLVHLWAGLGTLWLCASAAGQERPEALERLYETRAAIRTAHIEWSWRHPAFGDHSRFFTSRLTPQQLILVNRGDEDAVFTRDEDDKPLAFGGSLRFKLRTAESTWVSEPKSLRAEHHPNVRVLPCFRSLGLSTGFPWKELDETLWQDHVAQPSPRKYSEEVEGGLHVVTAQTDLGVIRWWLDPERGWQPVRIARTGKDGQLQSETRCVVKNYGGVWFPESVAFFRPGYKDGKEPMETLRIHHASFNQPDHPQSFTPNDIGFEVGMSIEIFDENLQPIETRWWDGEKAISDEEYRRRSRAGEFKPSATMARKIAEARARFKAIQRKLPAPQEAGAPTTPQRTRSSGVLMFKGMESEWEAYTRRFIDKYRLNEEQIQKALATLKACQQHGNAYVAKYKSNFQELDRRVKGLRTLRGEERKEAEAQIRRDQHRLLKPLNDIFEQQLKPRLDKLPTRAQRKAAEQRERPGERSEKAAAEKSDRP